MPVVGVGDPGVEEEESEPLRVRSGDRAVGPQQLGGSRRMCPSGWHVLLGRVAPSDMRIGGDQTGERSGGPCCGDGAYGGTWA